MTTTVSKPTTIRRFNPTVWFRSRTIMAWEIVGIFFINLMGGFLHFAFELSGFQPWVAFFASVNESTWEHLKFYFWAGILWALIEYTYVRHEANNFIFAKAMGALVTPIVVMITFYGYLAYALPTYGSGFLWADISTGVIGVIVGQMVSSYLLQSDQFEVRRRRIGTAVLVILLAMFSTFTYFPPEMRLFEDYYGYTYRGEYGILEDYTDYLIFTVDE
ncbi:MAG: DUF6512 family protein [Chloroflexota bacterium]